jgi:predicted permease
MLGRLLGPADDRLGVPNSAAAVVSWSYWKDRFNSDPAVLGRRIVVEGIPVTIVGVAPKNFFELREGIRSDIWVPLAIRAMMHLSGTSGPGPLALIGRLRPSVSIKQARAEMAVLFRFTLEERIRSSKDPLNHQLKFMLEPAGSGLSTGLRQQFGKPLLSLMAVVGLLLLIACTNGASLFLVRGAVRQREFALRVSLGAGRLRLKRQILTESLLLTGAGALTGVLLAYFGATSLLQIITSGRPIIGMPRLDMEMYPDQHVLLFTAGVAVCSGLLFGLPSAWRACTANSAPSLGNTGRGRETRLLRLFSRGLVVAQVALSLGLLSAAGLFIRHLWNLKHIDLGFRRDHILLVSLDPAGSGYSDERLSIALQDLLHRLQMIPGVRAATLCAPIPISGAAANRFITMEGHPENPENRRYVAVSSIAPKYFETLGTPLLAGRDFQFEDRGRPRVAIVNKAAADYYFPGGNAIGKHLIFDRDNTPYEIVGMVGDANYAEIREPKRRTIYLNTFQHRRPALDLAIHTTIEPKAAAPAVRRTVNELLKTVAVGRITTLDHQVDASIMPERLIGTLSGSFGVLGSAACCDWHLWTAGIRGCASGQ